MQTIVTELQAKVEKQIRFPAGYYVTYGGAFENLNAAKARLMIAVPVSLILIFLLLFFAFNSVKQGLLIYSAIPLSAIGGILFLAMRGMPFSISAGVGFIALFGVAVLNGIVLIAEFNRLKASGLDDVKSIVLNGTKVRLRPVLMTAFVASLGFLPMALSNGAGAEVQRPLATVVIGGLLIATFLTLFVLPVLYMVFEKVGIKPIKNTAAVIVLFLGFWGNNVQAQMPITLQAAIDTALKNNLLVKNEKLISTYQQALIKTAKNLPQANATAEIGQINSAYVDSKIGIGQAFSFPKVYVAQKNLLNEEWKRSLLAVNVREVLLKKQVTQVFYGLLYLQQKRQLLQFADTLYTDFFKRAELRLSKGESNVLEKATAETQLGQITTQLNQLLQDIDMMQLQFQLLLNTSTTFSPSANNFKLTRPATELTLNEHPFMQLLKQQQAIAAASVEVEKARLLPNLSVMYNNGSIRGVGADNKTYSGIHRFQSVQLGVGIPIFTAAQKAQINSAKVMQLVAESNYSTGLQSLDIEYKTAQNQYDKFAQTVAYFENTALANARLITTTANQQLFAGNINYLEWVQLVNQATTVRNDYVEAVRNLNEAVIQLNYFNNK